MDIRERVKNIEERIKELYAKTSAQKETLSLCNEDFFTEDETKKAVIEAKTNGKADMYIEYSLALGNVCVYVNGVILTQLSSGECGESFAVRLEKGDNTISFDLSECKGFELKKLTFFGYVKAKNFGSSISAFEYDSGSVLGIYNGAKQTVEIKYVTEETEESYAYFDSVKFFAMSKLSNLNSAVLICGGNECFTVYLFDLEKKTVVGEQAYNERLNFVSATLSGGFFVIDSSGALSKYNFDERLGYAAIPLGLYAKKVISSPETSKYVVIDSADKATLYQ